MNRRRLYRCRHDHPIAGVAAGLAEYLEVDPTLVRVVWIISVIFTGGLSFLAYLVMIFVVPLEPVTAGPYGPWQPGSDQWGAAGAGATGEPGSAAAAGAPGADPTATGDWRPIHPVEPPRRGLASGPALFGILLIFLGALALVDQIAPAWAHHVPVWPLFILGIGVLLVFRALNLQHSDE